MMYRHDPRWSSIRFLVVVAASIAPFAGGQPVQAYPLLTPAEPGEMPLDSDEGLSNVNAALIDEAVSTVDRGAVEQLGKQRFTAERVLPSPLQMAQAPEDDWVEDVDEAIQETDPDLGILRAYPSAARDPDLGILRATPLQPEAPPRPVVYFTARSSTIFSDNVFSSTDPQEDGIFQAGIGLRAVPALGSRTFAVLTANGNIVRYAEEDGINYDELELGASLFRQLTRRAYIDVGWRNEQLFRESGDRFLSDHQLQLTVGRRDQLGSLRLDSSYQLRRSFSDPERRSRLLNRLRLSASYPINADLDVGLSYQLSFADFIEGDRDDHFQQQSAVASCGLLL